MNKKRTSILSDLERNYKDTKSISKSIDLSAIENDVNPHQIYDKLMKNVDTAPEDNTSEKISVGDIVSLNGKDDNNQYEIINISNKDYIVLKNIDTDEVIQKSYNEIKPVMENIDMAKKQINETQYTVSISDLNTTDANALSQMMSAAAQADSGSAGVGGLDMTSTPELPMPSMGEEPVMEPSLDEPVMGDDMGMADMDSDEPSFEDSDLEGIDDDLPSEVENPLNSPEMDDEVGNDFDMESGMDDEPVDDIEFDEEIEPTEDELEMDIEEPVDDSEIIESEKPLEEAYNGTYETIKRDYLNGDMSDEEAISALLDCGEAANEEEAIDILNGMDDEGWSEDGSELYSDDKLARYEDTFGKDDELEEDILLPSETKDETFNAKKKLEDDKDEESERISEEMEKLINSILENSGAKTEQEVYAEEITEEDEGEKSIDEEIEEALKNAGVTIEEATVKPTIVTDESTFANKPNKATKPEDEKEPKVKEVSTSEFGAEASEPFHCPSMKCEAVAPKEKIKQIFETAKVRYSKTDKSEWNSLDRRYITKLIENGCGYQRASKIILEAKKR